MKNKKGQTSLLLVTMSFLSILTLGLHTIYKTSAKQMSLQNQCLKDIYTIQNTHAKLANRLEKMNPQALRLQMQERAAKAAVLAATEPATKAAALNYYRHIKAQQKLFRFKQVSTIQKYQSKALIHLGRIQRSQYNDYLQVPKKLHFIAVPKKSDSPVYRPAPNFRQKQKAKLVWKNKENQGYCRNYLAKETQWHPRIQEDKVLSKL